MSLHILQTFWNYNLKLFNWFNIYGDLPVILSRKISFVRVYDCKT